jgi:hypothetical protein
VTTNQQQGTTSRLRHFRRAYICLAKSCLILKKLVTSGMRSDAKKKHFCGVFPMKLHHTWYCNLVPRQCKTYYIIKNHTWGILCCFGVIICLMCPLPIFCHPDAAPFSYI